MPTLPAILNLLAPRTHPPTYSHFVELLYFVDVAENDFLFALQRVRE